MECQTEGNIETAKRTGQARLESNHLGVSSLGVVIVFECVWSIESKVVGGQVGGAAIHDLGWDPTSASSSRLTATKVSFGKGKWPYWPIKETVGGMDP